jgi:predicted double-glycine peptidase
VASDSAPVLPARASQRLCQSAVLRRFTGHGAAAGAVLVIAWGVAAAVTAQPVRAPTQPLATQTEEFDCGVAALATVLTLQRGQAVGPKTLIEAVALTQHQQALVRERGYSLQELALMALAVGAEPALERFAATALSQLLLPALVYLDLPTGPHFSVVTEVVGNRVALADPSAGFVVWSKAQFLAAWAPSGAGYVLTVTADPDASA